MIFGRGYPVVYVFDSTNTTFVEAFSLKFCTAQRIALGEDVLSVQSPYTKTRTVSFLGYQPTWQITVIDGDYGSNVAEFYEEISAGTLTSDVYKIARIQEYYNSGNKIRLQPHSDRHDQIYLVDCKILDLDNAPGGRINSGMASIEMSANTLYTNLLDSYDFAFGKGLDLEASSSQYCTVTSFDIGTTWSIEAWLTVERLLSAGISPVLVSKATANDYIQFYNNVSQNRIALVIDASTTYWNLSSNLVVDTKYHVVITRTGATVRLYINGADEGAADSGSVGAATNFEIDTLFNHSAGATLWDGVVAHVRLYKKVLSASDVTTLYNGGSGAFPRVNFYDDLYAMYEFDESGGTSTTETDQSMNAHTATIVNGATRTTWP